jgi:hypothetical protein
MEMKRLEVKRLLPDASRPVFEQTGTDPALADTVSMFDKLVEHEKDAVGLLAYGLYKQHKKDWLEAFEAAHGRSAVLSDEKAYAFAERLPRRIAAYRERAESLMARHVSQSEPSESNATPASASPVHALPMAALPAAAHILARKRKQAIRYSLGMLFMVFAMAVVFRLAGGWLFGPLGR